MATKFLKVEEIWAWLGATLGVLSAVWVGIDLQYGIVNYFGLSMMIGGTAGALFYWKAGQ